MAKENKTIGRVPVSRHEYTDGATYYKDNIVTRYGSAFQCVVDSTATPPATIDDSGKVTLGKGWIFFADASAARNVDTRFEEINAALEETTSEVNKMINDWEEKVADLTIAKKSKIGGILPTGGRGGSSNYTNYHIDNDGYSKISAFVGGTSNDNFLAIAFYGKDWVIDDDLAASSFISGIAFNGRKEQTTYEAVVPDGCVQIVVSCRTELFDKPTASLYKRREAIIPMLQEDVDSLKGNCIAERTSNFISVQPTFGGKRQLLADFGEDRTFDKIVVSFDSKELKLINTSQGLFELANNDGSFAKYVVSNNFYSVVGEKHMTTDVANGRYYCVLSNMTFRYLYMNYSDIRVMSGTIGEVMLESGDKPSLVFKAYKTGIDYMARNEIAVLQEAEKKYPDYWEGAVLNAIETVRSKQVDVASGDSFFFITDQHWTSNAQNSSKLIDFLSRKLQIPLIINGGDIIASHNTSLTGAFNEIRAYYDSFTHDGYTMMFSTIGNHDLNNNNNSDKTTHLSIRNLYNLMMKDEERWTDTNGSPYGVYHDNISQKIRYIQFYYNGDSGYIDEVATWLKTTMKATPDGYTVILTSHAYWNGEAVDDNGTAYANIVLSAMDEMTASVAMWIVGHNHNDRNVTLTSPKGKSLLIVSSVCDAYGQKPNGFTMTLGTDNEQAFDIVTIDTLAKKIYMTRVGAGSNRVFSY